MPLSEREIRSVRIELDEARSRLVDAVNEAKAVTHELDRLSYVVDAWANTLHREPKKRKTR